VIIGTRDFFRRRWQLDDEQYRTTSKQMRVEEAVQQTTETVTQMSVSKMFIRLLNKTSELVTVSALHCWLGVMKSVRVIKCCSRAASEVQFICTWSSWCHCYHPLSRFIKIQNCFTVLLSAYPGCPGKEALKRVTVCREQNYKSYIYLLTFFIVVLPEYSCIGHKSGILTTSMRTIYK